MTWYKTPIFFILLTSISINLNAQDSTKKYPEKNWGIGVAIRSATVPYFSEEENNTNSIVPLIFYDGDIFFFEGIGGGFKLLNRELWRLSFITKMRFVDIPLDYQNEVMGATADFGLQLRYHLTSIFYTDF